MIQPMIGSVGTRVARPGAAPARDLYAGSPEGRFLAAIPSGLRTDVWSLLSDPRRGGRGLRAWLGLLEAGPAALPRDLPWELVEVYLLDHDAEPLHDCEECGVAIPVRCSRRVGHEPVAERRYFPACPCCGGRTGRFAFWSRETQ